MPTQAGTVEIREVRGEERIKLSAPIGRYAFGASPQAPNLDEARNVEPYHERARNLVHSSMVSPRRR